MSTTKRKILHNTRLKSVVLKPGKYSLYRVSDNAGDSGLMFNCVSPRGKIVGKPGEIRLGHACQCGSLVGRTLQWQDWWLTTLVTEILEINEDKTEVRFKTTNSEYIAKSF